MNNNPQILLPVQNSFLFNIVLIAILLILPVQNVFAVTCHCFRDRSFDPARPASADPYILATTRNSLVAAASGIDKGSVVRLRMTGASETDLWLSHYLSTLVKRSPDELMEARSGGSSWPEALDQLGVDTGGLGSVFNTARSAGDPAMMARALAEQVLVRVFPANAAAVGPLREKGAGIAEAALSLYLAGELSREPQEVFREVSDGSTTWGQLLQSRGIRIDSTGDLIAALVRAKTGKRSS